jgi:bla regulator protein blaR1
MMLRGTMLAEMARVDLTPLANHLWQSTLCSLTVWLLSLALKNNHAAVRYRLWLAASVKFLLPFSLLVSVGSQVGWRAASAMASPTARPQWSSAAADMARPFTVSALALVTVTPRASIRFPAILLAVWLCGFALNIILWLRCWRQMRAARKRAVPLALGLPIAAMSSSALTEPGVLGIRQPILLLPEGIMDRLPPAQLDAVLAHEMCHVRRRDNLTATIHMAVEAIFWFYPLTWWIRTRLIEEREQACDEAVLQLGSDAEVYAEGILSVCKFSVGSPVACVSGISGSDLNKRIARIMTQRFAHQLTFGRKLLLAAVGAVAVAGPILCGIVAGPRVQAQSPTTDWQAAAGGKQTFDVASVKPNISSDRAHANFALDPWDSYPAAGGLLSVTNFPLSDYISFAFKLPPSQDPSLRSQMPKWATEERFDVQARAEGSPTKDQMRLMMQSLLADRFKLAVHTENRQAPVFGLVLAKPGKTGADLQPHSNERPCANAYPSAPTAGSAPTSPAKSVDGFSVCGILVAARSSTPGRIRVGARNLTMDQIASMLPAVAMGSLDRPILDQTGLVGSFDFSIEFTGGFKGPSPDVQPDPSAITFLEALQDQLGLKLKSQKGPVEVLVIDHVEKPSEN